MVANALEEYKTLTEYIIKNIKNNDKDLNKLMDQRENLMMELIKNNSENLEVIKELYISKGLLELDKRLKNSIEEEQVKVKEEIRKIHKVKNANKAYEKNRKINSFFNRKI